MAIDPVSAAAIASAAYPIVKDVGKEVAGLFGWKSQEKKDREAADQLINKFMSNPKSQFVNPQLLARAQQAAAGGMGKDPYITGVSKDWIEGRGGIPYDTNLANQLLRGDIPPSMARSLDRRIGQSFRRLRQGQGGQLANRGLAGSTFAARQQGNLYNSERNALTDAYMNTMLQRQALGLNILGQADASRRAYQNMGVNQLHRLADRDLSMQQLGFNVLSDADRRQFGRQTFGLNARLGVLGQQQARGDAMLEASGNILGNLYSSYKGDQRFAAQQAQQQKQFDQLLALSGGRNNPIQAKADLSAVSLFSEDSIMHSGNRFKTLGEQRTGAGGYGTNLNPKGTRFPVLQ